MKPAEKLHPLQLRSARVLLGWTVAQAVTAVGVSAATIHRAESVGGRDATEAVLKALRFTYEQHGIEFLFEGGVGVRLRPTTGS